VCIPPHRYPVSPFSVARAWPPIFELGSVVVATTDRIHMEAYHFQLEARMERTGCSWRYAGKEVAAMGLLWIVLCIGIYRYAWRWDWFPAVTVGALTAFGALMLVKGIDHSFGWGWR
jgi:hypothetical protein